MRITWNENIQPEHKERIAEMIAELEWLIPGWVQEMPINVWSSDDHDKVMSVEPDYSYRFVRLNVFSNWLNQNKEEQFRQMIHEIVHIPLSLIADQAEASYKNLLEDCPYRTSLMQELTTRHESATCDLTEAIYRKVYEADATWGGH